MDHEAMQKFFKKIPTIKYKPLSHGLKTPIDIDRYWRCMVLDKLGSMRSVLVN